MSIAAARNDARQAISDNFVAGPGRSEISHGKQSEIQLISTLALLALALYVAMGLEALRNRDRR